MRSWIPLALSRVRSRPSRRFQLNRSSTKRQYALIPLGNKSFVPTSGEEVTVYVKGFLARGEEPDQFSDWMNQHSELSRSKQWGSDAKGFFWQSGHPPTPFPLVSVATLSYTALRAVRYAKFAKALHPGLLAAGLATDAAIWAGRLANEYFKADKHAKTHSFMLAEDIHLLKRKYPRIRVVAHSLGCKILVSALEELPVDDKPDEIHLLAPALVEESISHMLPSLSKDKTFIYFSPRDFTLSTLFPVLHGIGSRAIGSHGLENAYPGVHVFDVDQHFGATVHTEYRTRFHRFAVDSKDIHSAGGVLLPLSQHDEELSEM